MTRVGLIALSALVACDPATSPPGPAECPTACPVDQFCSDGRCVRLDGAFIADFERSTELPAQRAPLDLLQQQAPVILNAGCRLEVRVLRQVRTSSVSRPESSYVSFYRTSFVSTPVFEDSVVTLEDSALPPPDAPGGDRSHTRFLADVAAVYDLRVEPRAQGNQTAPAWLRAFVVREACDEVQDLTLVLFPGRRLSGRVRDALTGEPQPDVEVWAVAPSGLRSPSDRTDGAGAFLIELPQDIRQGEMPSFGPEAFTVFARRIDELTAGPSWRYRGQARFDEGQTEIADFEIRLEPTPADLQVRSNFRVRGILDEVSFVEGATIEISIESPSTSTATFFTSGFTDAVGFLRVPLPGGGVSSPSGGVPVLASTLRVSIRPPVDSPFRNDIAFFILDPAEFVPGGASLPLQSISLSALRPELRGRIFDAAGRPNAGARIRLTPANDLGTPRSVVTGEDGRFSVRLETGVYGYVVQPGVSSAGSTGTAFGVVDVSGPMTPLTPDEGNLELPSSAVITRILEGPDRTLLQGVNVVVRADVGDGMSVVIARGTSDAQGRVDLELPLPRE